jgi:hypothetical protein
MFVVTFLGGFPLVVVLAATATVAGLQASARRRDAGEPVNQWVAGIGAGLIVVASGYDDHVLGLAVLVVAAASLGLGDHGAPVSFDLWANATAAWSTLRSGLFVGLAGAAAVGVAHVDSAVLIFLVMAVCFYDAGDYLCSAGYDSRVVGPIAGALAIAVWTVGMYVFEPPPLHRGQVVWFGAMLAIACPAGQLFGSWLLPSAGARAPGMRLRP